MGTIIQHPDSSDVIAVQNAAVLEDATLEAPLEPVWIGEYKLLNVLGSGGMGVVYRAQRRGETKDVALKLMRSEFAQDRLVRERLHREATAMRRIDHPNVLRLIDEGVNDECGSFLAFECLEGDSLATRMDDGNRTPVDEALEIIEQVLCGLQAAHEAGVIHRDLKPGNIFLVDQNDGKISAKLLDFGISQLRGDSLDHDDLKLTRTGTIVGTPVYMAPEQALAERTQDHRVDIYAAGVVLYELLSNELPHSGENYNQIMAHLLSKQPQSLSSRVPDLDPAICEIVHRAIARDPNDRYATARDFADAIRSYRALPLKSPITAVNTPAKRKRPIAVAVALAVSVLLSLAAIAASPMPAGTASVARAVKSETHSNRSSVKSNETVQAESVLRTEVASKHLSRALTESVNLDSRVVSRTASPNSRAPRSIIMSNPYRQ